MADVEVRSAVEKLRPRVKKPILLALGNPLLDMTTQCERDLLEKYGLNSDDQIEVGLHQLSLFQEVMDRYKVEYFAGGAAQNTVRVFQWLLGRDGASVFMGGIGKDQAAGILAGLVEETGAIVRYAPHDEQPTGTCAALINGTNRSLCALIGAANYFDVDHIIRDVENYKYFQDAEVIYVEGFFITHSFPAALEVAKLSRSTNKIFTLNLSAPYICNNFGRELKQILPYVDVLFGNSLEYRACAKMLGMSDIDTADANSIASLVALFSDEHGLQDKKYGPFRSHRTAVMTRGKNPIVCYHNREISEHPVSQVKQECIVDTTGAGDSFVAGFLSQMVLGRDLEKCIKCGMYASHEIIQRIGCTVPEYEPSEEFQPAEGELL